MSDLRETLSGLFLEVAIIEHLARSRVQRHHVDGMEVGQYGILGYLKRHVSGSDSVASIAWAFQEDEARIFRQVTGLHATGYVELTEGLKPGDTIAKVTASGILEHDAVLERAAPEFFQIVSEIKVEDLETTFRTLKDIRLVMDNLPDR
jgi:hypothetical protein